MKLKVGTKLKVTLLSFIGSKKHNRVGEHLLPCEGELVVTDFDNVAGYVTVANFFATGSEDPIEVTTPKFKLVKERKPYREVRVKDERAPHGVNKSLRVRIWKNGDMEILEGGRRSGYLTQVAALYTRLLIQDVRAAKKPQRSRKR